MAGCKKVLLAIRPEMDKEGVSMGVNRFYDLMKRNGMLLPKRKKYSCTTTRQDKSLVPPCQRSRGGLSMARALDAIRNNIAIN